MSTTGGVPQQACQHQQGGRERESEREGGTSGTKPPFTKRKCRPRCRVLLCEQAKQAHKSERIVHNYFSPYSIAQAPALFCVLIIFISFSLSLCLFPHPFPFLWILVEFCTILILLSHANCSHALLCQPDGAAGRTLRNADLISLCSTPLIDSAHDYCGRPLSQDSSTSQALQEGKDEEGEEVRRW